MTHRPEGGAAQPIPEGDACPHRHVRCAAAHCSREGTGIGDERGQFYVAQAGLCSDCGYAVVRRTPTLGYLGAWTMMADSQDVA